MQDNRGIVCIGKGGQAKSVTDVVQSIISYSISQGGRLFIDKYVDYDNLHIEPGRVYVIGFGSLKNLRLRQEIAQKVVNGEGVLATLIAPTAYVSPAAKVRSGTVVMHKAFIGPGADVGENCLINTGAVVEHDTVVGAHSLVLTNATVNGGCVLGQRNMVGSGAVILHGLTMADDVIVGAGAVATKNLFEPGSYVGIPARKIK